MIEINRVRIINNLIHRRIILDIFVSKYIYTPTGVVKLAGFEGSPAVYIRVEQ